MNPYILQQILSCDNLKHCRLTTKLCFLSFENEVTPGTPPQKCFVIENMVNSVSHLQQITVDGKTALEHKAYKVALSSLKIPRGDGLVTFSVF